MQFGFMAPFRSVVETMGRRALPSLTGMQVMILPRRCANLISHLDQFTSNGPKDHPETSVGTKSNSFVFTVQGTFIAIIAI